MKYAMVVYLVDITATIVLLVLYLVGGNWVVLISRVLMVQFMHRSHNIHFHQKPAQGALPCPCIVYIWFDKTMY